MTTRSRVSRRATSNRRKAAKAKKPKDNRVRHGGHAHRTVNAPKGIW